MAKTKVPTLQQQLEEIKKRAKSASTPADSASRQLSNYQTRIKASGVDPESITDKRNFIEKKLNLPENQMFILDALELSGRPFNALMSGADALASGADAKNAGGAFMEGLSGKEYKELKDVLKTVTKSDLGDKPGSFEAIDLVNLAGGIFLDPIDWALIPATGGAKLLGDAAQAGKIGMTQLADAAKVADTIKDGVKLGKQGLKSAEIVSETAEAAAKATKPVMKSVSDVLFQGAYKGIGKTFKFGDGVLEGTLKAFGGDEALGLYKGAKKQVTRAFTEGGREFKGMLRYADNQIVQLRASLSPLKARLDNVVEATARSLNMKPEVIQTALYDMLDYTGDMAGKPVKLKNLIEELMEDRRVYANAMSTRMIPYSDETWAALKNAFKSTDLIDPDDLMRHVQIGKRKYIKFDDALLDETGVSKLKESLRRGLIDGDADIQVGRLYTAEEKAKLEAFMSNDIMKQALAEVQGVMDETETLLSSISGFQKKALNKWSKRNDWRITHVMNKTFTRDEMEAIQKLGFAFGGNSKVIRNRTFNMSALEANRLMKDAYLLAVQEGKMGLLDDSAQLLLKDYFGTDMFVRDIKQGFDAYSGAQAKSLIRNKTLADILLKASDSNFSDPQLVTDISKGFDAKRFKSFTADEAQVIASKLAKINEIYRSPGLDKLVKQLRGNQVAINKYLYGMLNRVVDVEGNAMISILGKFNALYKTGKTLSPMFNIVNLTGNVFNMAMAGMSLPDIATYLTKAHGVISQKDVILRKVAEMGINALSEDEKSMYAVIRKFVDQGIFGMDGSILPSEFTRGLRGAEDIAGGAAEQAAKYRYLELDSINQIDQGTKVFENEYGVSFDELQKTVDAEFDENAADYEALANVIRDQQTKAANLDKSAPVKRIAIGQKSNTLTHSDLRKLDEDLYEVYESIIPSNQAKKAKIESISKVIRRNIDPMEEVADSVLAGKAINKKFIDTMNQVLTAVDDPSILSDDAFKALKKIDDEYGTVFTQAPIFDNRRSASAFYSTEDMAKNFEDLGFQKDGKEFRSFKEVLRELYERDTRAQASYIFKGKKHGSLMGISSALDADGSQGARQVKQIIAQWNADAKSKYSKLNKMSRSKRYDELVKRLDDAYAEFPDLPRLKLTRDEAYIGDLDSIRGLYKKGEHQEALKLFREKFPEFEPSLKSMDTIDANQAKAAKRLRSRTIQEFNPGEAQKYKSILEEENELAMEAFEKAKQAEPGRYDKLSKKEILDTFAKRTESEKYLQEHSSVKKATAQREKTKRLIRDKMDEKVRDAVLGNDPDGLIEVLAKGMKKPKDVVAKLVRGNLVVNQTVDQYMRMAMYLHGIDNPNFVAKLGVNTPMEAVRLALFDPNDLSYFEDSVLKKLIPFYTFTKKNLVYQMENLARHSSKYHRLYKGVCMMWHETGIDWANLPEYQQNQMFIPIPGIDAEGNYNYIRANLPFADAIDFAQDPLRKTLSSFTPAVRAPFEVATNTQIFTGMPIEKFQGQKGATIPFLDAKAQYALSQTGWDVPTRTALQFVDNMNKGLQGEIGLGQMVGQGINLTRQGNVQRNVDNAIYEDLDAIKEYVAKLKQAGTTLPTVDEAYSQNQVVNDLKAKLAKYTGIPK